MGTLVIEQWSSIGTRADSSQPVYRDLVGLVVDATTSTSDETATADKRAQYLSVLAVSGSHRLTVGAATTGSLYMVIGEGERRDIALPDAPGATVAYRAES